MTANPLPGWLAKVGAEAVVVRPDDINAEAHGNLGSFTLTAEQAAAVSVADIADFARSVVSSRQKWLSARGAGPMVIYWWHDEQAGQLRFSLVSAAHGRLPFTCTVVPTEGFETVASAWLGSPYLHGIPWSELRPADLGNELLEPRTFVLPVWSVRVP